MAHLFIVAAATETQSLTFDELMRAHQAGIWRYLRYLGAGDAEADDLTQETFLAVLSKPFEQRSTAEAFGYLRKVARNKLLALRRKEGRNLPLDEVDIADEVWDRLAGGSGDEMLDALDDCLEHVHGHAARAIDMHYRQELSRDEIAAALDLTPDGVKTLLRRTRATLRDCIERKTNH